MLEGIKQTKDQRANEKMVRRQSRRQCLSLFVGGNFRLNFEQFENHQRVWNMEIKYSELSHFLLSACYSLRELKVS